MNLKTTKFYLPFSYCVCFSRYSSKIFYVVAYYFTDLTKRIHPFSPSRGVLSFIYIHEHWGQQSPWWSLILETYSSRRYYIKWHIAQQILMTMGGFHLCYETFSRMHCKLSNHWRFLFTLIRLHFLWGHEFRKYFRSSCLLSPVDHWKVSKEKYSLYLYFIFYMTKICLPEK